MGSVKVTNNLLQKRKWIIKYWIWKPGYLILLVSFSVVVWFYHYCFLADCLFVWLGHGTCIPFPILFSVQSQQRQNVFCTHKSLICKSIISPTQNLHMYATYATTQGPHMQSYIYLSQSLVWLSNTSLYMCILVMNYILIFYIFKHTRNLM